jgi:hypothetical protein
VQAFGSTSSSQFIGLASQTMFNTVSRNFMSENEKFN